VYRVLTNDGSGRPIDERLVPARGYPVEWIRAAALRGKGLAAVVVDVALVLIAIFAIGREVTLIFVDVALIGVAVRAIFREIFFVASNIFLVVLDILLLRTRILALGIRATGEQTGKSNCEHTSTHHSFCVHF
jgi:hypothetical protein